ncbi:MAG: IS21 family transposase, partial [Bacteroidota bacterium]|nr:IS21 family transposase [Bacteroidota bacterium]
GARKVVMRLHHKAGDKLFVDFAGTTVEVLSRVNGEVMQAQIFVATLGCSNYTYVEATPDQKIRSWIGAGGVPDSVG